MYWITQKLIKERRCWSPKSVKRVEVKKVPIGEPNACLENANLSVFQDVLRSGTRENRVVAGWIVHKPNAEKAYGEAFQHWWNYDMQNKIYFDTTPLHPTTDRAGVEYVLDAEIVNYATKRIKELDHTVGGDLKYQEGAWICEKEINGIITEYKIDNLKIENFMHLKQSAPIMKI
ncbi:hypothetical protein [Nereida ignava]|uniref:hypothetical protein n=1 Tax=Nereida ignava TaxID=282199 RepID=UPI003F6B3D01